jgi:spore coat protein CotF
MAIYHVVRLLQSIELDEQFRLELYNCKDNKELVNYLNSKGFYFNDDDIDDAINSLHVQCQTLEEAQELQNKADWLRYLISGT